MWSTTFGEHPRVWGVVVGVGFEAAVGVCALSRDARRRATGLGGVTVFHLGLLSMGLWGWAVPVLAVVVPATVITSRAARDTSRGPTQDRG